MKWVVVATVLAALIAWTTGNVLAAAAALLVALSASEYKKVHARKEIERELPGLMTALAAADVATGKEVLVEMKRAGGMVANVARDVERMVDEGIPFERALVSTMDGTGSKMAGRAARLIVRGLSSGKAAEVFARAARTLDTVVDASQEKESALFLQKYSVLLSAGVFVPAVLGMVLSFAERFTETAGIETALLTHIILLSIISSLYAALVEGRVRNFVVYAPLLLVVSLLTYSYFGGYG